VGGLDEEIQNIFRRALSSRRLPQEILEAYGIKHVKGLILHGPPGTGKTLIARQLAKFLQAKEPKIVNGPELFNKFVGETEANMRKLFDDAKKDWEKYGNESQLHIIIFDEFDALAKKRGSSGGGTGVNDNLVNQLLSIIDGVQTMDNFLVIGMTNRLDLIDKAVLRPGRFEVHIEVGLPNEEGRVQILNIHTKSMKKSGVLGRDVDIKELAERTKNYTGAEIESVVKSANSFALNRHHNLMDFTRKIEITKKGMVEKQDFERALEEVKPEFGVEDSKLGVYVQGKLIDYGTRFQNILERSKPIIEKVEQGKISCGSILLDGRVGTGKTSIACKLAQDSEIPFVKMITPEDLIGKSEYFKVNFLKKTFADAFRSPRSLIILDNLERLVEYVSINKRFNNNVLQSLLILANKTPPKEENSICVIGTSSNPEFLNEMGFYDVFNVTITIPKLSMRNINGENEMEKVCKAITGYKMDRFDDTLSFGIKKLIFLLQVNKTTDENKFRTGFKKMFLEEARIEKNKFGMF
jgi:vesicle-fusing ATPase